MVSTLSKGKRPSQEQLHQQTKQHLVLDDSYAPAVVLPQQRVKERCLAGAQEPRDDLQEGRRVDAFSCLGAGCWMAR
jgi:hypothetical protein